MNRQRTREGGRGQWPLRHMSHGLAPRKGPHRPQLARRAGQGSLRAKLHHVVSNRHSYGVQAPAPSTCEPALAHSPGSSTNKGVHILLRAVRQVRAEESTAFSVDLNGDNLQYASAPVREEIEAFLAEERERPPDEQLVTLNGSYHMNELPSRMARVDWCIVPSTRWEIFGLVISEAWMFGKPVICSNVGGPGERVVDEVVGLHFQLGDHRSLARVMRRAASEVGLWERLRAGVPEPPERKMMVEQIMVQYLHWDRLSCATI